MNDHLPMVRSGDGDLPKRQVTVLVCDDDRLVLLTLAAALRHAGFEVIEADNGDDAILLARQHRPDIALLDIRMDGKSGLDVASYLRDYVGTPFMFLSAFSDELFIRKAREFGALDYLVKPVDIEKVAPAVNEALRRAAEEEGRRGARGVAPVPAIPKDYAAHVVDGGTGTDASARSVAAGGEAVGGHARAGGTGTAVGYVGSNAPAVGNVGGNVGGNGPAIGNIGGNGPARGEAFGDGPAAGSAATSPAVHALPAGVERAIAVGILMERFRLTRGAAEQRIASIALRAGRSEDSLAGEFVRGIDALNAAGNAQP